MSGSVCGKTRTGLVFLGAWCRLWGQKSALETLEVWTVHKAPCPHSLSRGMEGVPGPGGYGALVAAEKGNGLELLPGVARWQAPR